VTVIGLTGRCCAGKSYVGSLLEKEGIAVIEVDRLGHKALSSAKEQIVKEFGATVLNSDGEIERKKVGEIVFSDLNKLKKLEAIIHPAMVLECENLIKEYKEGKTKAVVINAALLQKMGLDKLCDTVIYAYAPSCIRFKRAVKRDKATVSSFRRIEKAQKGIRFRDLKGHRETYIVHIWLSEAFIYRQVHKVCATIMS